VRLPSARWPDIAAWPSSRALAVRSRAVALHLSRPKRSDSPSRRAADSRYPTQPPSPFRTTAAARKDDSHRLLQPTYSTSTGVTARFLRRKALCSTLGAGGGSFDAAPPALAAPSTPSSRVARRGAPHREGCFADAAFSTAGSARSPTSDALLPKSEQARMVRAVRAALPSRNAPCSVQGAFHRQVLPAARAGQGTRHRFGASSRRPASGAAPSLAFA